MKDETFDKIYHYTFAGCCGILGFVGAYLLLGLVSVPLEHWLVDELK